MNEEPTRVWQQHLGQFLEGQDLYSFPSDVRFMEPIMVEEMTIYCKGNITGYTIECANITVLGTIKLNGSLLCETVQAKDLTCKELIATECYVDNHISFYSIAVFRKKCVCKSLNGRGLFTLKKALNERIHYRQSGKHGNETTSSKST